MILRTLLRCSLAVSNLGNELVKPDHLNNYLNLSRSQLINDGGEPSLLARECRRGYRDGYVLSSHIRSFLCGSLSGSPAKSQAQILSLQTRTLATIRSLKVSLE